MKITMHSHIQLRFEVSITINFGWIDLSIYVLIDYNEFTKICFQHQLWNTLTSNSHVLQRGIWYWMIKGRIGPAALHLVGNWLHVGNFSLIQLITRSVRFWLNLWKFLTVLKTEIVVYEILTFNQIHGLNVRWCT